MNHADDSKVWTVKLDPDHEGYKEVRVRRDPNHAQYEVVEIDSKILIRLSDAGNPNYVLKPCEQWPESEIQRLHNYLAPVSDKERPVYMPRVSFNKESIPVYSRHMLFFRKLVGFSTRYSIG